MWSKRNLICFSEKYGNLLYVGNTSTFLKLDDIVFNQIQEYINSNKQLSNEIYNELVNIGAIVESDDEVLNQYLYKAISNSFMTNHMELWICMTNTCNFKCSYCYEKEEPCNLDINTINLIIPFINKHKTIKTLTVYFYGGEPLLNAEGIFNLSLQLSLMKDIQIKYQIITNGYLLNKKNIERLSVFKDMLYQITIDGTEKTHNSRRPHKTNNDSYQTIIQNLDDFYSFYKDKKEKPIVHIRYNVDNENKNEFHTVYSYFHKKYNGFFDVYSSPVECYEGQSSNNKKLMTAKEYSDFIIEQYEKYGIYENKFPNIQPPHLTCGAATYPYYCISSKGDVYKCPADAGHTDKIYMKLDGYKIQNSLVPSTYTINSNPWNNEICKQCFLLFSCMGSCCKRMQQVFNYNDNLPCKPFKYNTKRFLEIYYENNK